MESILRLLLATFLGLLIGLERELRGKSVGLRTCGLVSLSCCLISIISIWMYQQYPNVDPTRIMASIPQAIGFLGIGIIIHKGTNTFGLTTAATILGTASIGLAVGTGAFLPAIVGWLLVAFTVIVHIYIFTSRVSS